MNLIDEKGRVFGKINLFDLVILLLLLLTIITACKLLFFNESLRILISAPAGMPQCWPGESPYSDKGTFTNVTLTLLSHDKVEAFEKGVVVGDSTFPGAKYSAEILEKNSTLSKSRIGIVFYDILVKIRLLAFKKNGELLYNDQKLKIGETIRVVLPNIFIDGEIQELQEYAN